MADTSPLDATVNGTPMSVLIGQAVKLKSAQEKPLRKKFDAFPVFLQNSIFPRQETIDARAAPFEERIEEATKLKMLGNAFAKDGSDVDSLNQYEFALAVFKWLNNTNPNWKTEGIKDDFLEEKAFQPSNENQRRQVLEHMINVYNNIAIVSIKVEQFGNAIAACDSALLLDQRNVKALFLRSKARCTPKSCGTIEEGLAMKDLMIARRVDPKNTTIAKELERIRAIRAKAKASEKERFDGVFQNGKWLEKENNTSADNGTETGMQVGKAKKEHHKTISSTSLCSGTWTAKKEMSNMSKNTLFVKEFLLAVVLLGLMFNLGSFRTSEV